MHQNPGQDRTVFPGTVHRSDRGERTVYPTLGRNFTDCTVVPSQVAVQINNNSYCADQNSDDDSKYAAVCKFPVSDNGCKFPTDRQFQYEFPHYGECIPIYTTVVCYHVE